VCILGVVHIVCGFIDECSCSFGQGNGQPEQEICILGADVRHCHWYWHGVCQQESPCEGNNVYGVIDDDIVGEVMIVMQLCYADLCFVENDGGDTQPSQVIDSDYMKMVEFYVWNWYYCFSSFRL